MYVSFLFGGGGGYYCDWDASVKTGDESRYLEFTWIDFTSNEIIWPTMFCDTCISFDHKKKMMHAFYIIVFSGL